MSSLEQFQEFDGTIRKVIINGEMHFSVIDVFKHYGSGSRYPQKEWERAKSRLEEQGFDVATKMSQHQFPGQGQRPTPVANFDTFLRIAMIVSFKNWEGIREYMVTATHEKIEAQAEAQREREALRQKSKRIRLSYTETLIETHENRHPNFARATNAGYKGLFNMVASEIIKYLGLNESQAKYLRDHIGDLALTGITAYEAFAKHDMLAFGSQLSDEQQAKLTYQAAQEILQIVKPRAERLKIDLVSGRPLLAPPDYSAGEIEN
ncbi:MAG: hypothetical protein BroJett018_45300 [Chloroflexota bacterium]|nr:hypothetical protein [Chloroflexota bacterium]NOG65348.1 hypothetical protein [Chloroflexota bacterium]GIK66736.1 MAG: hypothetical protein BroJett018_45300 [Chloroflexota bacterium]